ncbi:MAG: 4a-hydroxytetrahydrobiopterin dehydratase [Pseudomonadota bacterium]
MSTTQCSISDKHCVPCSGGAQPLAAAEIQTFMKQLSNNWQVSADNKVISCDFPFKNYYQTMAFVNAIAWMAHSENHHPDLEVGYNHCLVRYTTHAIGGLSENDFICAAKVDALRDTFGEKTHGSKGL